MMMTLPNLIIGFAQAAEQPAGASPLVQFMPLIFIFVIFYFLLIRPQQKQRKQHASLVSSLKTGDKVVTNAGIYGLISNVKDSTISLKIADNVKVEMDRSSVARRIEQSPEA